MFVYAHIKLCYRAYTPLSALKKNKKIGSAAFAAEPSENGLPHLDSNQDKGFQRPVCCHYTMGEWAENLAVTAKCLLCHMSPTPRVSTCRTSKKRCLRCTKSVMRTLNNGTRFTDMGVTPQTCGTYAKHARATRHQANKKPCP